MRVTVGVLLAIVILFGGFTALSMQADQVQDTAVTNGTNQSAEAYNLTSQLYNGVGQGLSEGLVYMGIGAILVVALGYLVVAGKSGR